MAICLFAHVIHQSTFRTEKIEARVDYCTAICLASRPVHFARPWTQVFDHELTDSIALGPRRNVPRRFT